MSACPDREAMLQALHDGELDATHALEAENHLKNCAGCAAYFNMLQALRTRLNEADLSPAAPARLRARIETIIAAETRRPEKTSRRNWWSGAAPGWSAAAAMSALAATLLVFQVSPAVMPDIEGQLVASHVRSLLADHLIDVETSDRHVVKPWFNGRIDFAPPVPDLATAGFPLAGGRLDYAGGRAIAAIVYRRRAHVINLFILPHPAGTTPKLEERRDSYSVTRWTQGDLDFWAVSDIDRPELEAFREAFVAASAP
jgi:anti-sigma factor RsiW